MSKNNTIAQHRLSKRLTLDSFNHVKAVCAANPRAVFFGLVMHAPNGEIHGRQLAAHEQIKKNNPEAPLERIDSYFAYPGSHSKAIQEFVTQEGLYRVTLFPLRNSTNKHEAADEFAEIMKNHYGK